MTTSSATTAPPALAWSTDNCHGRPDHGASSASAGTVVVLREVFNGVRRFDDMHRHSGIPRQVLSNRLALLVEEGILRREPYRPDGARVRHEYRLTAEGVRPLPRPDRDRPTGATRYLADPEGPPVEFAHRGCGSPVHAVLECEAGHRVDDPREVAPVPGPGATRIALRTSVRGCPLPDPVDPLAQLVGVATAAAGPPHSLRSAAWVTPCGWPVRWCQAATRPLSSRRSTASCSCVVSSGDLPGRAGRRSPACARSLCRWAQQVAHLVGLEQPGDAEEVHLLLRPDVHLARVAELAAVEQHPVEARLRAERLERQRLSRRRPPRRPAPAPAGRPRRRRCRPRR